MPEIDSASCNIGDPEVGRRKIAAIFSGALTLLTAGLLLVLAAPREFRFVIFVPVIFTVIGWYQTQRRFCYVRNGWGI